MSRWLPQDLGGEGNDRAAPQLRDSHAALFGSVEVFSIDDTNDGHAVMGFVDSVDDPVGASTCAVSIGK